MDSQLLTLSKIFTERLFRIPDYQRGYAWGERQLKDFWSDIDQLANGNGHYTGVLTLENVPESAYGKWEDDTWIVASKSYEPFYVVDGQQRLTTSIILLQVILEAVAEGSRLNFTDKVDIRRKFIYDSKDEYISRSYIFGYEKDNPSYNFLKSHIFNEPISETIEETVYTQNLSRAKDYFETVVKPLSFSQLETLYKKVTQGLLFNIFTISNEVDVCVAFETMNNRGKPLSVLELLKNRLIYLSLKFDQPDFERDKLRKAVNDCWRALYHNLGRNKDKPLDDDKFLFAHYLTYFRSLGQDTKRIVFRSARYGSTGVRYLGHIEELLERRFIPRNISDSSSASERITLADVYNYVRSLQDSVEAWYNIYNPTESKFSQEVKIWLDRLIRIGAEGYLPVVLVVTQRIRSDKHRAAFLQALERFIFVMVLFSPYTSAQFGTFFDMQAIELAVELNSSKSNADNVLEKIVKYFSDQCTNVADQSGRKTVISKFRANGFYEWPLIKYFLYEYDADLQSRSKTSRSKINWADFNENKSDFYSVEHIWPQQARHESWVANFGHLNQKQKVAVRNSIGNLLPLSRPKNASLSNKPFLEKARGKEGSMVSYKFGGYAENEISEKSDWTPKDILDRGLNLLKFMERRWAISLGTDDDKLALLGMQGIPLTSDQK